MLETFDYIVVGGGSAGCAAASRLVLNGNVNVLILEAGHSHHHPLLDMPPGVFKLLQNGSKYFTTHQSEPQMHLGGKRCDIPQGNVLGGGSSVNGQAYVRGRPDDYDKWQLILENNEISGGWAWQDVLPFFKSVEGNVRLNNELHNTTGPLTVSDPGHICDMSKWFVQSLQEQGEPFNSDFNGHSQRGVGYFQFTYNQGQRISAAYAFIEPLKNDPRLTVRLNSQVLKIIIEDGVAVGVSYKDKSGIHEVRTRGEVILSSGALVTPKLLMLSGLGPAEHLNSHGIDVLVDLPGVGQNLQDHPDVPIVCRANGSYGYYKQDRGLNMIKNGAQFKLFGSGLITTTGLEAATFVNPLDPSGLPTHEAYCIPVMYLSPEKLKEVGEGHGVSIQIVLLKPYSRGEVLLASANPDDMALIYPNFLKDSRDMEAMLSGLKYFRETLETKPISEKIEHIIVPDPHDYSDEALVEHCKEYVKTNFHPAGTAKMGADDDPMSVLDAQLSVRGVIGLRVCDMSAVPELMSGNTNAPAIMLGGRCADFILNKNSNS